ncbi:hypothetical protein A6U86_05590 [Rhizobium sp. AC27/96]|nr:hypothetical protein A6U86_05590 [Rhizobium sp. AC27/96]
MTDTRPRHFRMVSHPLLDKPELTASAADIVLAGRIEDADIKATLYKLRGEVCRKFDLMVIACWHAFVALTDDADGGVPDRRIEMVKQSLSICVRRIVVASAIIEERLAASCGMPAFSAPSDETDRQFLFERDKLVTLFVSRSVNGELQTDSRDFSAYALDPIIIDIRPDGADQKRCARILAIESLERTDHAALVEQGLSHAHEHDLQPLHHSRIDACVDYTTVDLLYDLFATEPTNKVIASPAEPASHRATTHSRAANDCARRIVWIAIEDRFSDTSFACEDVLADVAL